MSRITWKNVEFYLNIVNSMTKNKYDFYKTAQGNQLVLKNEHGGMHEISRFLSTTEAYEVVYAMYNLLKEENK